MALAFLLEAWQSSRSLTEVARHLGTGVEALKSVPTALYAFVSHSHDFSQLLSATLFLGGDVDTLASMAGALAGAHLGQALVGLCARRGISSRQNRSARA